MLIGVPKEIKNEEHRVALTPAGVKELIIHGHEVWIEKSAGEGASLSDKLYRQAGAHIGNNAQDIYNKCDIIVKVKEPQAQECKLLREGQIILAYLHLAPNPILTGLLLKSGCIAIGYETVTDKEGRLPILSPMSQIAGRLAIQVGAHYLEKIQGGNGILLGGVPGVEKANVVVIGAGTVGSYAVRSAIGFEASVIVLDSSLQRLQSLDACYGSKVKTVYATKETLETYVKEADLVIGAVLIPGAIAPIVLKQTTLKHMRKGSVIIDVAIDQGGCFETSKPTTHTHPVYLEDGIIHYCVTNMPGSVPQTASYALNNVILPFIVSVANQGYKKALLSDPYFLQGLNIYKGVITQVKVAQAQGLPYVTPDSVL